MSGHLTIVGLGPGASELVTPAVADAITSATDIIGYETYVNRIPALNPDQVVHASDNGHELVRARHALTLAADEKKRVVVVSGGDPGVFAMAAAVFEAVEDGPSHWRNADIRVEPGISAMLAAAAQLGAPLGGDFCAISLSDNLKSWQTIEARLEAAAKADFAIALYNPASKARPEGLRKAFATLAQCKAGDTVVAMVRAAGTSKPKVHIATLETVDASLADMRTLVLIGASTTRTITRQDAPAWVYTPRSENKDQEK